VLARGEWLAAIEAIDTLRPGTLFIDIQMPGTCLDTEVLARVAHQLSCIHDRARAARRSRIRAWCTTYLLKPFAKSCWHITLERVRAALGEPPRTIAERFGEADESHADEPFVFCAQAFAELCRRCARYRGRSSRDYIAAHCGATQPPADIFT